MNSGVEIYIARHGQNEDNANGRLNGHRDLPLTEIGRQQARDLALGIVDSGIQFDYIYSSPLSRALETAQIVSQIAKLPEPMIMESLIERDFGAVTGKPVADIEKLCAPDIIQSNTTLYFLSPEGSETFPDLIERGKKMLAEVRAKHKSGKVLLVTHGDYGKMIYTATTGKDWHNVLVEFHFGNGDLIDISRDGDVHMVKLEQFNH